MLRIVCDQQIALTPALQAASSDIRFLPGRQIDREDLLHADVLLVRSVTKVSRELLEGTPIRFVGTATAGMDHIDLAYLRAHGIGFASAPGANAISVFEYVLAALAECHFFAQPFVGRGFGIVGYGHIGRRLAAFMSALGCDVKIYDPPAERYIPPASRATLAQVLEQPVISLHASLTTSGPYPSFQIIDRESWSKPRARQIFINAARGALVTESALLHARESGVELVIDAWPDEPRVSRAMIEAVAIGSPHIAGYTRGAKLRATDMLVDALARARLVSCTPPSPDHSKGLRTLRIPNEATDHLGAILDFILKAHYPIREDDHWFKAVSAPAGLSSTAFDRLRSGYQWREELAELRVIGSRNLAVYTSILAQLGVADIIIEE
jgi:erythronate-4-phosphate dehydrogenase